LEEGLENPLRFCYIISNETVIYHRQVGTFFLKGSLAVRKALEWLRMNSKLREKYYLLIYQTNPCLVYQFGGWVEKWYNINQRKM